MKKSNIHIKKSHRGDFTNYCGGKVTSECIAKGKSSPNPKIRKQATFAANARTWKHQYGGQINGPTVESIVDLIKNLRQQDQLNELVRQQQLDDERNKVTGIVLSAVSEIMNPIAQSLIDKMNKPKIQKVDNKAMEKSITDFGNKLMDLIKLDINNTNKSIFNNNSIFDNKNFYKNYGGL